MNADKQDLLKVENFLKKNRLAVLATVSLDDNAPQASFVYYMTDENFNIYVITSTKSRKMRNIFNNNKVALVIGQEVEPTVLQLEGTAVIVDDPNKKEEIVKQYLDLANQSNPKSLNYPPVMKIPSEGGFIVLKINITSFKYSNFSLPEALIIEGDGNDLLANNHLMKK